MAFQSLSVTTLRHSALDAESSSLSDESQGQARGRQECIIASEERQSSFRGALILKAAEPGQDYSR